MNCPAALLLLLAGAACSASPPSGAGVTALTGGTVIDVVSGRSIPDAVVLISAGHILSLGPKLDRPVPPGARVVELPGSWIIPGLIDSHVELAPWGMRLAARWGVTTVRDFAADSSTAASLLGHADSIAGPRLIIALPLAGRGSPGGAEDSAPDTNLRAALARLALDGADWVALSEPGSERFLERLVGAARSIHLPVATSGDVTGAAAAARAGVNSIEGLWGIARMGESAERNRDPLQHWARMQRGWLAADTARLGTVAASIAGQVAGLVPALVQNDTRSRLDDSELRHRVELGAVPQGVRATWDAAAIVRRTGWTRSDFADFRMALPLQNEFVRRYSGLGGLIAVGSHASQPFIVPGASVHREMELLVAAGLTPLEALRAATSDAARLLGADTLGRLGPGSVADLVVLSANPLDDIRNSREISRVMIAGRWLQR